MRVNLNERRVLCRAGLGAGLAGLAIGVCLLAAGVGLADTISLEVVGVQPLGAGSRGVPKEQAIQEALWEGVRRVARELLVDAEFVGGSDASAEGEGEGDGQNTAEGTAEDPADPERLRQALGKDIVPYTRGFKIVEDRGVQPALFSDDPDVESEYVVVVEVQVDQDNVRRALVAAGLLTSNVGQAATVRAVSLEVVGLVAYPGLEALQTLLLGPVGATRVTPVRFERGRTWLRVEGDFEPAQLLERLIGARQPGLSLTPLPSESGGVLVRASWTPPDPALSAR